MFRKMPTFIAHMVFGVVFVCFGVQALDLTTNISLTTLIKGNASSCCTTLHASMGDRVSFQGRPTYNQQQTDAAMGYWSLQEAELRPACRVASQSSAEVAEVIRFLAGANCTFAVRGGGHTSWGGAANIGSHGLTIDLSGFNNIEVSADRNFVSVGAGSRWGDVYSVLDMLGLAVSGGRVAPVGVAGLTLGGGKSFFASLYGFACDNVVNYELVTGQGLILQVNKTSYPDLFKALKGGSNNFGVVTRFDLATFKQGDLWGGEVVYLPSTAIQQFQAFHKLAGAQDVISNATGDAQVIFAYVTTPQGSFFANFYTHTQPEAWPEKLTDFKSIQPQLQSSLRISNLSDFATELGVGTPNGYRYIFGTLTFGNDIDLFEDIKNISDIVFAPLFAGNAVPDLVVSVVLQPLTAAMLRPGHNTNSLGLSPEDGNLVVLDLTVQWMYQKNNTIVNQASKNLINRVSASAKQRGLLHPYVYLNYALQSQRPIASYGAANVAAMRKVSHKYDPGQVFQKLVPGGFKL